MTRIPPQAQDAEENVLGACLQSSEALETCLATLRGDHFYIGTHGRIFEVMRLMHGEGRPVDPVTLHRELDVRHVDLDPGRLNLLVYNAISTRNVSHYAKIVADTWAKREAIKAFTNPWNGLYNGASAPEVIKQTERICIDLRSKIEDDEETRVVSGYRAAEWIAAKVARGRIKGAGVGVPFSFLSRLMPGRLYVLGGYTKDGKTALMMQFLKAACKDADTRVGVVTIEMSWEDLTDRLVASYGVPYKDLQEGEVRPPAMDAFRTALAEVATFNIDLIDDAAASAAEIARYQRIGRYQYLIIDYLQRIPYKDRLELNREVKAITTLARKAKIPILLLSQFSRPFQQQGFPRPTMNSFAETSFIEKEASMAMAIWRKRDPETGKTLDDAELLVLANRYGPTGSRPLYFDGAHVRFTEVTH